MTTHNFLKLVEAADSPGMLVHVTRKWENEWVNKKHSVRELNNWNNKDQLVIMKHQLTCWRTNAAADVV